MCLRSIFFACTLFSSLSVLGQQPDLLLHQKKLKVLDTIIIDTLSINPFKFQVSSANNTPIDQEDYRTDFIRGLLLPAPKLLAAHDSVQISYYRYPIFLTRPYYGYNEKVIVHRSKNPNMRYRMDTPNKKESFRPFDGLDAKGNLSRSVTLGNNQNASLNSILDLRITGKITENIQVLASIRDDNVPLQQNGYAQSLNEFDQVFVELTSKNWGIRAGDILLNQTNSFFNRFTKQIQGISVQSKMGTTQNTTQIHGAAAIVRGKFVRNQWIAKEGNQGPYKLTGDKGELLVRVVPNSERVFVNGTQIKKDKQYTIDYPAGEITFLPVFPIHGTMRITLTFQSTQQNFVRAIGTAGGSFTNTNWSFGTEVYTESDLKNQSLQHNLNNSQKQILADAGDQITEMVAPSEKSESLDENKILYKKEEKNQEFIYVFSKNPEDELFRVQFTAVGANQGNYRIRSQTAIAPIFEYIPPIQGIPQGDFAPIVQLQAPEQLQIGSCNLLYKSDTNSTIGLEVAVSKSDKNLFSTRDDRDNTGSASRLEWNQRIFEKDSSWGLQAIGSATWIQQNFRTVEPLYNIEFNRDWNSNEAQGDQGYFQSRFLFSHPKKGSIAYGFEGLQYSKSYSGTRSIFATNLHFDRFHIDCKGSLLQSKRPELVSRFLSSEGHFSYIAPNKWSTLFFRVEENKERDRLYLNFTTNTQRFFESGIETGFGDRDKVFSEFGFTLRNTDSVVQNQLNSVQSSQNFYVKSNVLQSKTTRLAVLCNYRILKPKSSKKPVQTSVNANLDFAQRMFSNIVNWNLSYQTYSGTLSRQAYTFAPVDPGVGRYTWVDYNANGIQELNEFEIANFKDQANYLRVLLPNQIFLDTQKNQWNGKLVVDPAQWKNSNKKFKKWIAKLYVESAYGVVRKVKRFENWTAFDPFQKNQNDLMFQSNWNHKVYFNRGKNTYELAYSFLDFKQKNLEFIGTQIKKNRQHEFSFLHQFWNCELGFEQQFISRSLQSEVFENRNYMLKGLGSTPKISYLIGEQSRISLFYKFNSQKNTIGEEALVQHNLGASCAITTKKYNWNLHFTHIHNAYNGNAFSPVGYQLLEGLQPETNFTWKMHLERKITSFLNLNLSYHGRKSEQSRVIHSGDVKLTALF